MQVIKKSFSSQNFWLYQQFRCTFFCNWVPSAQVFELQGNSFSSYSRPVQCSASSVLTQIWFVICHGPVTHVEIFRNIPMKHQTPNQETRIALFKWLHSSVCTSCFWGRSGVRCRLPCAEAVLRKNGRCTIEVNTWAGLVPVDDGRGSKLNMWAC